MQKIEFKNFIKVSTNKIYGGKFWTYRQSLKNEYLLYFLEYKSCFKPVSKYPVKIQFDFEFAKNALDTDNCSFMCKMWIDSITHYKIIENDTNKFVNEITITCNKSKSKEDKMVMTIFD